MPDRNPDASAAHWSDYWATGALTSLPEDFAFNYDGEVADFWYEQFDALPASASLLDICTGNGPIALLAAGYARQANKSVDITAVDAAAIRPDEIARRRPDVAGLVEGIRFVGQTPVESLPFEDGSFDLITSQYGLEYCRLDLAAPELARVLRPGGRLVLLCHSASSEMIETMAVEQRDYQALASAKFFRVLRSWVGGQLGEADLPDRLKRIQRRLGQDYRQSGSALIAQVMQSVSSLQGMNPTELRENRPAVAGFLGRLEAGRDRLEDMLRVNRMIAGDADWDRPLAGAGLVRIDSRPLVYRQTHSMGQCHTWQKPG